MQRVYYELRYKSDAQMGTMLPKVYRTDTFDEAIKARKEDKKSEGIEIIKVTKETVD